MDSVPTIILRSWSTSFKMFGLPWWYNCMRLKQILYEFCQLKRIILTYNSIIDCVQGAIRNLPITLFR